MTERSSRANLARQGRGQEGRPKSNDCLPSGRNMTGTAAGESPRGLEPRSGDRFLAPMSGRGHMDKCLGVISIGGRIRSSHSLPGGIASTVDGCDVIARGRRASYDPGRSQESARPDQRVHQDRGLLPARQQGLERPLGERLPEVIDVPRDACDDDSQLMSDGPRGDRGQCRSAAPPHGDRQRVRIGAGGLADQGDRRRGDPHRPAEQAITARRIGARPRQSGQTLRAPAVLRGTRWRETRGRLVTLSSTMSEASRRTCCRETVPATPAG